MSSKNSNQSPGSNAKRISKNWKIAFDRHKTTNSLILEDHYRSVYVGISPKNIKNLPETNSHKFQGIQRHSSEEDFKKHFGSYQTYEVHTPEPMPASSEDEYYTSYGQTAQNKFAKAQKMNIERMQKYHPKIGQKQKPVNQHYRIQIKSNNPLKQTSSTQSAENLKINSQIFQNKNRDRIMQLQHSHYQNNHQHQTPTVLPIPMPSSSATIRKFKTVGSPRNTLRRENFKIISKLGQGKFGKVFMVKQISTGFVLAMKIIQKKKIMQQNLLDQFIREIKIQSFLNHQNIISVYGFFYDQTHFYTLMQLGCDGQLYSMITNNKTLTEQATSFIIKNLLEAIKYIHQNQVLHRDIKPENIVIIMGNVKLCDFGWAVNKLHPGDLRNTFCGTPLYLSPQILQGNRYDEKVDLWAIGILAYQLIFGCSPFDIVDQSDLAKIIKQQIVFPKQASQQFQQFITAMLTKNPKQRLTSQKLLELDFVFKYQQFQTCQQLCK